MKTARLLLLLTFLTPIFSAAQSIHNGKELFAAMHDRYKDSWYQTVTFTQKSTTYKPDGSSSAETWYEAALLPGKLRIDFGDPAKNNGAVLVDGDVTILKEGKVAASRHSVNMLLVLGFDVYKQAPETTAKIAEEEGYDLSILHEETWEGKAAYVVGAERGNLAAKQFWIDKDTLLFVRVIEPSPQDASQIDDIRFTDYRKLAGAWIAARVEVHANGKLVFSEDYSDIQANVKLSPAVFDPQQYGATHWEK